MNKVFSFALLAVVFASCQTAADNDPAVLTSDTTDMTVTTMPVSATADTGNAAPVMNPETAPATNQSVAGINPEHGKPGHRCDIPVGASLDSPPGTRPAAPAIGNAATEALQSQVPAPVMSPQPVAEKGQRLNPQHGQPGHDCAVPVGSPLKG